MRVKNRVFCCAIWVAATVPAACAAAEVPAAERWQLAKGHEIVFVQDDEGGFGAYEIGRDGQDRSVLQSRELSEPLDVRALHSNLRARPALAQGGGDRDHSRSRANRDIPRGPSS